MVEDVGDLWAMERAAVYRGIYHVLGGTLSAIDGRGPAELNIDRLITRASNDVDEVILALSATVEGQTTAHYLHERLSSLPLELTRLAHGVPVGGELDYLDDGTLAQALKARSNSAARKRHYLAEGHAYSGSSGRETLPSSTSIWVIFPPRELILRADVWISSISFQPG